MKNLNGKGNPKKKKLHGPFSSALAYFYSAPAYIRVPGLPPITAPPTLTVGTHLSGPSSPKSSLAPRPRVVADEFPVAEPSTCRFLLAPVPPPTRLHPGAAASLLMPHRI
jgi:hypothetical protein